MNQATRFTKLALLLVVAGALALAGCGGGSDGAMGEAGPAGMVGPAGPAGPEGPAGPAGPAGADGMDGMDGAQGPPGEMGPAGPAGADGAAADAGATIDMIWEAISGPAIQAYLQGMVMPSMTRADVENAVTATAAHFMLEDGEAAAAAVVAMFGPPHVNLQGAAVADAFRQVRMNGMLAATADSTAVVLMGDPGMPGAPGADGKAGADGAPGAAASVDDVWYAIAGAPIRADLVANFGSTGPRTVAQLNTAIQMTADKYGLSATDARAYLNALHTVTDSLHRDEVNALAATIGDMLAMMANAQSAIAVIVAAIPTTGTPDPGTPDPGTPDPGTPPDPTDMTMVSYIDTIIGMDDLEEVTYNDASNDAEDYMSMYIGDTIGDPTKVDDDLYTFMARPSPSFGDLAATSLSDLYGGWMKYNFFGSLVEIEFGKTAMADKITAFSIGMESGSPPMGRRNGRAHWNGAFVGHHHVALAAAGTAATQDDEAVSIGEQATGNVGLEVRFDADGTGDMLTATFEIDKGDLDAAPADVVMGVIATDGTGGIDIQRGGNFAASYDADHGVATGGAGDGAMIDGQFYGPAGDEAGGIMVLVPHASASNTTYKISGAFGTAD